MSKTILYPFKVTQDFRIGYAWSAELARRLNRSLSLFTTISSQSNSADVRACMYNSLADAQGFYMKSFHAGDVQMKPVRFERNFLEGEFEPTLLNFMDDQKHGIVVIQSGVLDNSLVIRIIKSRLQVIVLATDEVVQAPSTTLHGPELFLTLLRHSAFYNIPPSVFDSIGQDRSLFNSIAVLFRK